MTDSYNQRQNHLLAALPASDYKLLSMQLELIHLPQGKVLCESGAVFNYVYFPITSVISLLHVTEEGACAEIAVVGSEGMIGVSTFMGAETALGHAVVQNAGYAYRLNKQLLRQKFDRSDSVRHVLLRYTQALITHMAQTVVCNRHHSVDQQLCRWLLLNLDRSPTNELAVTHESIANKLGVRREGVTDAAGKLRSAGLIHYARGHITVLDRPRLEDRSCECYAVVKNEFDHMLPHLIAA
ncbi:Crp/Fnr family transcriptional regulator [Sulfuricaulis limicola]|uniref:Crp/Fnr family transcriptional regulator n=1 Tax=Sulfuricaulis limicola TaxID=1620215 RepID=A0A1B4XH20_9GAMM|nr:Crp/Fnr family transcriptional regulator [Sulfuricaulis limicola]BAV34095.1 Crp/Fnr family transcriptional regulator [Sulfuricaulis limicola]